VILEAFYKLALNGYLMLIYISALFNLKAKIWLEGRKNWHQKLAKNTADWKSCVWFHCASLGEFEQGRPIIEKIKKEHPSKKILLSFFSPSGYEIRASYELADYVCYLPIDTFKNAQNFIKTSKCDLAIFIKYEWWYFYFKQLNKCNIPLYVVSTLFRPQQIFFKWYGNYIVKC